MLQSVVFHLQDELLLLGKVSSYRLSGCKGDLSFSVEGSSKNLKLQLHQRLLAVLV